MDFRAAAGAMFCCVARSSGIYGLHFAACFAPRRILTKAIIALLTVGAAGAGVLAVPNSNPQFAIFAGFFVALLSALAGKFSVSQSRQRSAAQEDLFVPDLSVATLDRVLPVLIRRLRDAGLAPIFVIDELDKVDSLTDRINAMVFRLKKLIAEEACFCFVADLSVLPYILLHGAQMHPIDLRRELTRLSAANGNVEPLGAIRTNSRFLMELRIQVAIELLLDDENMRRELERQAAFHRLAYGQLSNGPWTVWKPTSDERDIKRGL